MPSPTSIAKTQLLLAGFVAERSAFFGAWSAFPNLGAHCPSSLICLTAKSSFARIAFSTVCAVGQSGSSQFGTVRGSRGSPQSRRAAS